MVMKESKIEMRNYRHYNRHGRRCLILFVVYSVSYIVLKMYFDNVNLLTELLTCGSALFLGYFFVRSLMYFNEANNYLRDYDKPRRL